MLLFYLADQYASKAAKAEALMQQEKELRILSSTDTLTGVLNRGAFLKLLPSILTKAIANNSSVAVLYIDIDDFKSINDVYGHSVGDLVIVDVVSKLQRYLKAKDIISRLGGDEFAIALLDFNSKEDIIKILDRIFELFRSKIEVTKGHFISQTVSIGIAIYDVHSQATAYDLINQADAAMYDAKHSGKNNYHFYNSSKNS